MTYTPPPGPWNDNQPSGQIAALSQYATLNTDFGVAGSSVPSPLQPGSDRANAEGQIVLSTNNLRNMVSQGTYTELGWQQEVNRLFLAFENQIGERSAKTATALNNHLTTFIEPTLNAHGFEMGVWNAGPVPWSSHVQLTSPELNVFKDGVSLEDWQSVLADAADRASTSGSGTGGAAPIYVAPDRRVIEELVTMHLTAKTGNVDDPNVQRLTDMYLSDHKTNWVRQARGGVDTTAIDPEATVIEEIRKQPDYRSIHKFRPDTEPEDQWIGQQIASLKQQGVQASVAEERGQAQAALGGRQSDATVFQQNRLGRSASFIGKASQVASAIGRIVR